MGFWYHGVVIDFMDRDLCDAKFVDELQDIIRIRKHFPEAIQMLQNLQSLRIHRLIRTMGWWSLPAIVHFISHDRIVLIY